MPFPLYPVEPTEQKDFPLQKEVKLLPRHAGHKLFREVMMAIWVGTLIAAMAVWPLTILAWSFWPTLITFLLFWLGTSLFFLGMFRAA